MASWKRVPKGFKVVWKPRTDVQALDAGQAAIAREVDLHGVTVVGERTYGSQRFALVVLNAKDRRDYRDMVDPLGASGSVSSLMEERTLSSGARRAAGRTEGQAEAQSSLNIQDMLIAGDTRRRVASRP